MCVCVHVCVCACVCVVVFGLVGLGLVAVDIGSLYPKLTSPRLVHPIHHSSPPPSPHHQPPKVLFCGLTGEQRDLYRAYLASGDVVDILAGQRNALQGLDILRKVCVCVYVCVCVCVCVCVGLVGCVGGRM